MAQSKIERLTRALQEARGEVYILKIQRRELERQVLVIRAKVAEARMALRLAHQLSGTPPPQLSDVEGSASEVGLGRLHRDDQP